MTSDITYHCGSVAESGAEIMRHAAQSVPVDPYDASYRETIVRHLENHGRAANYLLEELTYAS